MVGARVVNTSDLNITITGLRHFSLYEIKVLQNYSIFLTVTILVVYIILAVYTANCVCSDFYKLAS